MKKIKKSKNFQIVLRRAVCFFLFFDLTTQKKIKIKKTLTELPYNFKIISIPFFNYGIE